MIVASLATSSRALVSFANIALDPGGILEWIVAGLLAGWLAGLLVRGHGFGCLGDIAVGLLGAFIGAFVLSFLPITITGISGFVETFIVAFVGAFLLVAVGRLLGGSRRPRRQRPLPPRYNPYYPPRGPYGQP